MKYLDRRSFLKTSALASASLSLLPALGRSQSVKGRVRGANEDIRVAVVGFNGRGRSHIEGFRKLKGVRIVALCDVDQNVLDKGVKEFKDRGETVAAYRDIRKLLENPDIDVVSLDALDYPLALALGLPIGSGMIESGHRHGLQTRLKKTGAAWLPDPADQIAQRS